MKCFILDFAQLIEMRVNEQEGDQVEYYFHFEGCKLDAELLFIWKIGQILKKVFQWTGDLMNGWR